MVGGIVPSGNRRRVHVAAPVALVPDDLAAGRARVLTALLEALGAHGLVIAIYAVELNDTIILILAVHSKTKALFDGTHFLDPFLTKAKTFRFTFFYPWRRPSTDQTRISRSWPPL